LVRCLLDHGHPKKKKANQNSSSLQHAALPSSYLASRHISIVENASITRTRRDLLRFFATIVPLELGANTLDALEARVTESGRVAKVRIDACTNLARLGQNAIERRRSLVLRLAVPARAVELAKVADEEVGHSQCSAAVVL